MLCNKCNEEFNSRYLTKYNGEVYCDYCLEIELLTKEITEEVVK